MEVNFASLKLTWLLSCGVQSASSIRRHARCIVGGKGGGGGGGREGKTGISRSNIKLRQNSYFATVVGNKVTKTVFTESTVDNNSDSTVQGHDGNVLHAVCVQTGCCCLPLFLLSFLSSLIFENYYFHHLAVIFLFSFYAYKQNKGQKRPTLKRMDSFLFGQVKIMAIFSIILPLISSNKQTERTSYLKKVLK